MANPFYTSTLAPVTGSTLASSVIRAEFSGIEAGFDAVLVSPALTGTPTAPTAAPASNSTQLATTGFVQNLVGGLINTGPWVSGTTYEAGATKYSLIDFKTYRRMTAGDGVLDPRDDPGNWVLWVGDVSLSGAQTLTNKTIESCIFIDAYTEEVNAPAAGSSFSVTYANGSIHHFTTNSHSTVTLPAPEIGRSFQVRITFGGVHTITWAVTGGSTIGWPAGSTPTVTSINGKTDIFNFTANAAGTKWFGAEFGKNF